MSHNRTTQYSAPYKRNSLLGLHQYAASDQFPSLGRWDSARSDDLYVVRGTASRTQPVNIIVVGAVSSDRANLRPHGNYDPNYMLDEETIAKKAKLQFVITSPEDDPDFSADYALSLRRLKEIQEEIAASTGHRNHFIQGSNMKMNFLLFSEKELEDLDPKGVPEVDPESLDQEETHAAPSGAVFPIYEVAEPYRHAWRAVNETHNNNVMEVYGTNELPVDYRYFDKHLRSGTTVVVTFTLKHFAIREKGSTQILSDTFSASVQSVSILKEAESPVRRTFKSLPKRRPLPVPQFPSRASLQLAADVFSPVVQAGDGASSSGVKPRSALAIDAKPAERNKPKNNVPSRHPTECTKYPGAEKNSSPEPVDAVEGTPPATECPLSEHSSSPAPSSLSGEASTSSFLDSLSSLSDSSDGSMPSLEPIEDFFVDNLSSEAAAMAASVERTGSAMDDEFSSWVKLPSAKKPLEKIASPAPTSARGRGAKKTSSKVQPSKSLKENKVFSFTLSPEVDKSPGPVISTSSESTTRRTRTTRKPRNV